MNTKNKTDILIASKTGDNIFSVVSDHRPNGGGVPIYTKGGLFEHKFHGLCAQFFVNAARKDAAGNVLPTPMSELIGETHLLYASGKVRNTGKALIEKTIKRGVPCLSIPISIDVFYVDMDSKPESKSNTYALLDAANGRCIGSEATDQETGQTRIGMNGLPIRKTLFVRLLQTTEQAREFPLGDGDLVNLYGVHEITAKDAEGFVVVEGMTRTVSKFRNQVKTPKGKEITRKVRKPKVKEIAGGIAVEVAPTGVVTL